MGCFQGVGHPYFHDGMVLTQPGIEVERAGIQRYLRAQQGRGPRTNPIRNPYALLPGFDAHLHVEAVAPALRNSPRCLASGTCSPSRNTNRIGSSRWTGNMHPLKTRPSLSRLSAAGWAPASGQVDDVQSAMPHEVTSPSLRWPSSFPGGRRCPTARRRQQPARPRLAWRGAATGAGPDAAGESLGLEVRVDGLAGNGGGNLRGKVADLDVPVGGGAPEDAEGPPLVAPVLRHEDPDGDVDRGP